MIKRLRNRIYREIRRRYRRQIPFQAATTFQDPNGANWYEPGLVGPSTFAADCCSAETIRQVADVVERLSPEPYARFTLDFYRAGLKGFGESWRYADILTVLHSVSRRFTKPTYLEIGVRRGRSMAVVGAVQPEATMIGFDSWVTNYVGQPNPGPKAVESELERIGFRGSLELVSGNSRQTVPDYFSRHPDVFVDLATIDGDHSARGAKVDIRNVVPRLKIGGVIVFDDICNPDHTYLMKVWHREVAGSPRFASWFFDEVGYGVAFAIKRY